MTDKTGIEKLVSKYVRGHVGNFSEKEVEKLTQTIIKIISVCNQPEPNYEEVKKIVMELV